MDLPRVSPQQQEAWRSALQGNDDALLSQLVESEPPIVTVFQIGGYINGFYRGARTTAQINADLGDKQKPRFTAVAPNLTACCRS